MSPSLRKPKPVCARCGHPILAGQLRLVYPTRTEHVACPTERQVAVAKRWGRW